MASPSALIATVPRWRFILHGGCAETCPDTNRQQDISQNLQAVAETMIRELENGTRARDAVVLAVSALEDFPVFNAGRGAALNRDGVHQLEAGIAEGSTTRYGAVGCTETVKNPIRLANTLLERGPHTMLVGCAADKAAKEFGLDVVPNSYFTTPFRKAHLDQADEQGREDADAEMGTVGAIVLDSNGHLAAGGSTGGPTGKQAGRIGDTAILGTGLYTDAKLSVLCNGTGDQMFKQLVAANVAKYHSSGSSLSDAARRALREVSATGASCALAVIDAEGNTAVESTARLFSIAWGSSSDAPATCLYPTTIPVLPSHEFYNDGELIIGHSRYPTMPGHTLVIVQSGTDLFSLRPDKFVRALIKVSTTASLLRKHYDVERCALVTEGGSSLSILPLHGLSKDWEPVTNNLKEFHESFPGYISSKNGPMMAADKLDEICSKIQAVSGLSAPFNYRFDGDEDNANLFARIIRGELQQWRVWEDDHHVAFLTPFANTPGFTVLTPRKHLSSDVLSINKAPFSELMMAAHRVAVLLKKAFGASWCGMIFEGFEINYAHVKLIPILTTKSIGGASTTDTPIVMVAPFQKTYQGYVSSLDGPLFRDFEYLTRATLTIRNMYPVESICPPRS